jgi:hypothetical protein
MSTILTPAPSLINSPLFLPGDIIGCSGTGFISDVIEDVSHSILSQLLGAPAVIHNFNTV